MEKRAWITFLSSNNYYIYLLLGLYKDLLDTKTKYPIYCGITKEVSSETRKILTTVGINLIDLDTSCFSKTIIANSKRSLSHYTAAFAKLALLDTKVENMFDKVVYIDTDVQVFKNIDDIFDMPHMSAIEDLAPAISHIKYTDGGSIFCSGLFVWDFKNNPGEGHKIITKLDTLNMNIIWHDQNVLNYFYNNWIDKKELHINPVYNIMNNTANFKLVDKKDIKAIHYTDRIRDGWPFIRLTKIRERYWKNTPYIIDWIKHLSNVTLYFNTNYKLNLPPILDSNLICLTEEQEKAELADGTPNTYLSF